MGNLQIAPCSALAASSLLATGFSSFSFLLFTWFFVRSAALDFFDNASFLTFLLEALQGLFQRFVLKYSYFCHFSFTPPPDLIR